MKYSIGDVVIFERNGTAHVGTVTSIEVKTMQRTRWSEMDGCYIGSASHAHHDEIVYHIEAPNPNEPRFPIWHEEREVQDNGIVYQCKFEDGDLPECPRSHPNCHSPCDLLAGLGYGVRMDRVKGIPQ